MRASETGGAQTQHIAVGGDGTSRRARRAVQFPSKQRRAPPSRLRLSCAWRPFPPFLPQVRGQKFSAPPFSAPPHAAVWMRRRPPSPGPGVTAPPRAGGAGGRGAGEAVRGRTKTGARAGGRRARMGEIDRSCSRVAGGWKARAEGSAVPRRATAARRGRGRATLGVCASCVGGFVGGDEWGRGSIETDAREVCWGYRGHARVRRDGAAPARGGAPAGRPESEIRQQNGGRSNSGAPAARPRARAAPRRDAQRRRRRASKRPRRLEARGRERALDGHELGADGAAVERADGRVGRRHVRVLGKGVALRWRRREGRAGEGAGAPEGEERSWKRARAAERARRRARALELPVARSMTRLKAASGPKGASISLTCCWVVGWGGVWNGVPGREFGV